MAFNLADVLKDVSDSDINREQIEYIPLDLIDEDPNNFYQLTDIPLLADNISLCGLQQPIRVRAQADKPGRYIIVSGHRRRAALEMLVADGYSQWHEAPCIVEHDVASPALQQLRLIYANANTRKMSSAEIGEQAEQVEKLLYQLKEEGYDFPGRMRDHVAEAVSASKSKLARLKVIRENLAAVWADAYKGELIGESVAYNLARMAKSWQTIIHNVWGEKPKSLHADMVSNAKGRFQNVTKIQCEHGFALCEHTVSMMEKNCKEMYYAPCTGCCFDCSSLQTCKSCCPQAEAKKKEMKTVAKQAQLDAKREQEERDRPGAEFARLVWQRVGLARKRSGATIETLVKARGESIYNASFDDPKQEKMENGEGDYSSNSTISFGYNLHACDVMRIVAVADALNCSVDYLLGRTDVPEIVPELGTTQECVENVSNSGTIWQTGEPTEEGVYLLRLSFGPRCYDQYEDWTWDGSRWHDDTSWYDPDSDGEILGWIPMPKEQEKPNPTGNGSCFTGISPSGHCGAAARCSEEYTCCLQCPEDCNSRCGWLDEED